MERGSPGREGRAEGGKDGGNCEWWGGRVGSRAGISIFLASFIFPQFKIDEYTLLALIVRTKYIDCL